MEAVLDTNVLVSAAINPKGPPAQIIRAWRAHSFVWVTSPPLLDEAAKTLASRKVTQYLTWTKAEIAQFWAAVSQSARIVSPTDQLNVIQSDPSDNRVLEAAIEGHADYIVSGDRDLLDLGDFQGIRVVTPARFLAILATTTQGPESKT